MLYILTTLRSKYTDCLEVCEIQNGKCVLWLRFFPRRLKWMFLYQYCIDLIELVFVPQPPYLLLVYVLMEVPICVLLDFSLGYLKRM